jgi:hypothetical protein
MSHVIILARFEPSPVGHGGNHRSYQIQWDCIRAFGSSNVTTVSVPLWRQRAHSPGGRETMLWQWRRRLRQVCRNPAKVLVREGFSISRYTIPGLLEYYEQLVTTVQRPAVCIIEDIGFSDFIPVNARCDIPTVACPHNIESFDAGPLRTNSRLYNLVRLTGFADEFAVLSRCVERLFISKVEAGLISGLGLTARYYPYQPVGQIEQGLQAIRERRRTGGIVSDLFIMIGTAGHKPTRASFRWFIDNALQHGLPEGIKVVVAGKRTNELEVTDPSHAEAFEFRGWVEQAELDDLLSRVCGVLIPQSCGFGAMTRLPELSYAGVPVIVSQHPTMAIDPVPGVVVVGDDWSVWCEAIRQLSEGGGEYSLGMSRMRRHNDKHALTGTLSKLLDR